jgi:adenine nucleotide transporter 17
MPGGDQAQAPPIVHAIGGALGTAIAVLLFYPLERARIELQAQAQRRQTTVLNTQSDSDVVVANDELESVHANVDVNANVTVNTNANVTVNTNADGNVNVTTVTGNTENPTPLTTVASDSSWESAQMDLDPQVVEEEECKGGNNDGSSAATPSKDETENATPSPSWSMRSSSSLDDDSTTGTTVPSATGTDTITATKSKPKRLGLIDCLIQLHAKQALYQGLAPVVTTIATSQFVFFYLHATAKKLILAPARQKGKQTALLSLATSCLAGIVNVLLTNPLWVVNMAIITGNTTTSNLWKELKIMAKDKGFQHLWTGTSASLLLVSNPVIQFFCYEQFKQARIQVTSARSSASSHHHNHSHHQRRQSSTGLAKQQQQQPPSTSRTTRADRIALSPTEAFLVGALSKAVATISTYPLQLTQTVLRLDKVHYYHGTWDCLKKLVEDRGIEGLFTGMRAKLLQTVLTAAFTFLTYEQILGVVQATLLRHDATGGAHPRK